MHEPKFPVFRRISPLKIPDGYNVIFVDCIDPNVENYNFTAVLKATGMAIDTLSEYSS